MLRWRHEDQDDAGRLVRRTTVTCLGAEATRLEIEFGGTVQSSTVTAIDDLQHDYQQGRDERHRRRQSQIARGWSVVEREEQNRIH